ncbi:uncharacterized protein METZ01_LOCUS469283, partial [marine metagenome]
MRAEVMWLSVPWEILKEMLLEQAGLMDEKEKLSNS